MECPQVGCDGLDATAVSLASRSVFHFDREIASEPLALPPVVPAAMPEQVLELWTFMELMVTVRRRVGDLAARGAARSWVILTSRMTATAR